MDSKNNHDDPELQSPPKDWATAKQAISIFVRERDWEQFHALKELIIGLNIEAGELLEQTLWADKAEFEKAIDEDPEKRQAILDECADVLFFLIRILDKMDADPWRVLEAKMSQNAKKYPVERAKGRSDKYTAYQD